MSDLPDNTDAPQGNLDPHLENFRQAFSSEEGQGWADEVTTRLNDYAMQRQIATATEQRANGFVQDLADFKDGLSSFVERDPLSVHSILGLVPRTIDDLIGTHPTYPEENKADAADAIKTDVNRAVAQAAVRSAAEKHEGMARGILDDERISGLFTPEEKSGLHDYIDMQELARGADANAMANQNAKLAAQRQATTNFDHVSALYNPSSDATQFPPGWASKVVADDITSAQDKADLMNLYGRLQTFGDAEQSNPFTIAKALGAALQGQPVQHNDLINAAGRDLKVADAAWLGHMGQQDSVEAKSYLNQVDAHIQAAKAEYLSEPTVSGAAAFGRFMNWFMPRARGGVDLNPASDEYALGQNPRTVYAQFHPTGDDVAKPAFTTGRSLADIFGGR